jgi:hypothetical protein
MGLSLAQFWRMTPLEFVIHQKAFYGKREDDRRFLAAMTLSVVNISGKTLKHPLGLDEFLCQGKPEKQGKRFSEMDEADRAEMVERIMKKVERKKKRKK